VSALSIPIGENGTSSSADFNPNHNYVNATPNKQASRLPHVHTTKQPSSKITIYQMYLSQSQSVK
jgi:hypothetical protein